MKILLFLVAGCFVLSSVECAHITQKGAVCEKAASQPQTQFPFSIIPRVIKTNGKTVKITLAAVLSSSLNAPGAEVVATSKGGKTCITYSREMKKFIKSQSLSTKTFKPLEAYLFKQVKKAKANPSAFVSMLDGYLKLGAAQNYTIDVSL